MSSKLTYIIDENLTPDLVELFRVSGLHAAHVNELKTHQKQRVVDDQLRRLAIQRGYVIVTKDDDFVKSYVNREVPERMVYVYGLNDKEVLLSRMKEVIPQLESLMEKHSFIEVNKSAIRFPFST